MLFSAAKVFTLGTGSELLVSYNFLRMNCTLDLSLSFSFHGRILLLAPLVDLS